MEQSDLRKEIKEKHGRLAQSATRSAAIKLFCIECMGGSRKDAANCETQDCFLWKFRPGQSMPQTPAQKAVIRTLGRPQTTRVGPDKGGVK